MFPSKSHHNSGPDILRKDISEKVFHKSFLCVCVQFSYYTQVQAFGDWSFQDFTPIEKFLCIQIFPIDSIVKLPHISSFLY